MQIVPMERIRSELEENWLSVHYNNLVQNESDLFFTCAVYKCN